MSLIQIENWFHKATPEPTFKDFTTQLGVDLEEVAESLELLASSDARSLEFLNYLVLDIRELSQGLKDGSMTLYLPDENRAEFAKEMADRVVTAIGSMVRAKMKASSIIQQVADSNDSKFVDGQPIFDENRKITKGPNYWKPNLAKLV